MHNMRILFGTCVSVLLLAAATHGQGGGGGDPLTTPSPGGGSNGGGASYTDDQDDSYAYASGYYYAYDDDADDEQKHCGFERTSLGCEANSKCEWRQGFFPPPPFPFLSVSYNCLMTSTAFLRGVFRTPPSHIHTTKDPIPI